VLESARDLLQYMVRRGQMTQEEADKLMREVEASHAKRKPFTPPAHVASKTAAPKAEASHAAHPTHTHAHAHAHVPPTRHVTAPAKHAAKHAPAAKKPAAKKPTMKPAAKKHTVKSTSKSKPKASGKTAKKR
jgi:hypothetical protein